MTRRPDQANLRHVLDHPHTLDHRGCAYQSRPALHRSRQLASRLQTLTTALSKEITSERTIEVLFSGEQLVAKITGGAGIDGGEMRPLIPRSQTVFEGVGIGYRFIVDDKGAATAVEEIHISGDERFQRQRKPN
jgi:ribosomal protein S6E (S10)